MSAKIAVPEVSEYHLASLPLPFELPVVLVAGLNDFS